MKKIKKQPEGVVGLLNGKRIKTSLKKWRSIIENPDNKVVFKEDGEDTNEESKEVL